MCARRFLILVFVLTLLAVGGAFAIFQFGGKVLLRQATPRGHFAPAAAGAGPDYRQASSWIARPALPDDPSRWRPANDESVDPTTASARVFYVHPTTYLERDRWNAPLSAGGETEYRTRLVVQSQASAFNRDAAEIWAPRYRQAAYGAFLLKSEDAQRALDLAYGDVQAAFDEFLRRAPPESPIVLAGHSQGALHLSRLLRDRRAQLGGRLVAAYVVGWPLSATADLPAMGHPACASTTQLGCILSWQSFAEPANPGLILEAWEGSEGPTGRKRALKDMVCVNPLTGTLNGAAPPQANSGTLVPTQDLRDATLEPGRVGAHCANGFLILGGDIPKFGTFVLPGNNYHVYDFALFWGAVRDDVQRRLRAWQPR